MGLLDELKAKADSNNDGKISSEDLAGFRNDDNNSMIDQLKAKADVNNDGKISFDDVKSLFGK